MLGMLSKRFVRMQHTVAHAFRERYIVVDKEAGKGVALVRLNRPDAHNALSTPLLVELKERLEDLDADDAVRVIVITGSDRIFSAGADIKEMEGVKDGPEVFRKPLQNIQLLKSVSQVRKPTIAAVHGFAFGGGCELAMQCDIIYASNKAKFAQPEVNIGTIPGAGGTQRLTRAVGKSLAMELVLSGNRLSADEAKAAGLVSKLLSETMKLAEKIAEQSPLIVSIAKQAVNEAFESTLEAGLRQEIRFFDTTFMTEDRREGMKAFKEKRAPRWTSS